MITMENPVIVVTGGDGRVIRIPLDDGVRELVSSGIMDPSHIQGIGEFTAGASLEGFMLANLSSPQDERLDMRLVIAGPLPDVTVEVALRLEDDDSLESLVSRLKEVHERLNDLESGNG